MHPWHDIDPGQAIPEEMTVFVEVPMGSRAKYSIDKKTGLLELKSFLRSEEPYPFNYGFIPQTVSDDTEALDVIILSPGPIIPWTILTVRVVGAIELWYPKKEYETKIVTVEVHDQDYDHVHEMTDLSSSLLTGMTGFFESFRSAEHSGLQVKQILDRRRAEITVTHALREYEKLFLAA